jgi:hypothetical protein
MDDNILDYLHGDIFQSVLNRYFETYYSTRHTKVIFKLDCDCVYFSIDCGRHYHNLTPYSRDNWALFIFFYSLGYHDYYYNNVYK